MVPMPLALVLFLCVSRAHAVGAGVWKDPGHFVSDASLAGLRFIAESPEKTLTMIGTDNGAQWWKLTGTTDGTNVHFDFSPKGGPEKLTGVWSKDADGTIENILWPDGNQWSTTISPSAEAFSSTLTPSSHGLFLDSAHYVPGTFAGVRVFAETPHHVLQIIGSDDGKSWWYLTGDCHGPGTPGDGVYHFVSKDYFAVDFTPKGGPNVVGSWDHRTLIKFPDGNTWYKPPPAASLRSEAQAAMGAPVAAGIMLALAAGALAYAARKHRASRDELLAPPQL